MIRWIQPVPQPDGSFLMREMEHPCIEGCGGWWRQPRAESGTVVELIDARSIKH